MHKVWSLGGVAMVKGASRADCWVGWEARKMRGATCLEAVGGSRTRLAD